MQPSTAQVAMYLMNTPQYYPLSTEGSENETHSIWSIPHNNIVATPTNVNQ
jgi:hypothetical protein